MLGNSVQKPIVTGAITALRITAMPKPDPKNCPMLRDLRKHVDSKDSVSFLAQLLAEYQAVVKELRKLETEIEIEDLI